MNVKQALQQLTGIAADSSDHESTLLMIDCPNCGRSGELGSIRTRVVVGARLSDELEREQTSHDAELRRIAEEIHLPWPSTVEDIVRHVRLMGAESKAGIP